MTIPRPEHAQRKAAVSRLVPLLALPLLGGCYTPPPGIEDEDVIRMENVRQGDAWIFFRQGDVPREQAVALAPEVEAVRQRVGAITGVSPPRAQLVVFGPSGPAGSSGAVVDRVLCLFLERDYTIRFRYPLEEEAPLARAQLLGTVGHEVAEATVLGQVTAVDPYLRWMCDGVAELVEHEVLVGRAREDARELLGRTLRFVQERRARGVQWVDLTRWRQLGERVHRTQSLLADGAPSVSLDDLPGALVRVRRARAAAGPEEAARRAALDELEALLVAAETRGRLGWRPGEGRTDDPDALDYLYYNAAFALWLHVERAAPGALGRFMAALAARHDEDPVLVEAEALALVRQAGGDVVLPALDRVSLAWIEGVLRDEERRLSSP